jgi:hypothetical protein
MPCRVTTSNDKLANKTEIQRLSFSDNQQTADPVKLEPKLCAESTTQGSKQPPDQQFAYVLSKRQKATPYLSTCYKHESLINHTEASASRCEFAIEHRQGSG